MPVVDYVSGKYLSTAKVLGCFQKQLQEEGIAPQIIDTLLVKAADVCFEDGLSLGEIGGDK